jgi:hypothetical protein
MNNVNVPVFRIRIRRIRVFSGLPDPRIRIRTFMSRIRIRIRKIRICLAPWIRIRNGIKSWIQIRIETNADPQQCFLDKFKMLAYQIFAILSLYRACLMT